MADPTPTAQVTAREIPITIQGSQIVEGTERRELFTETLKTALIFDNGAAVNLKARVAPGQSLFLRNELSGREILCRVIEAPPPGETGCTDLEFTIHDPDFWNARSGPANVEEEAAPQESTPATAEIAAATPNTEFSAESSAPVDTAIPPIAGAPETPATPAVSSLPEQLEPPSQPAPKSTMPKMPPSWPESSQNTRERSPSGPLPRAPRMNRSNRPLQTPHLKATRRPASRRGQRHFRRSHFVCMAYANLRSAKTRSPWESLRAS